MQIRACVINNIVNQESKTSKKTIHAQAQMMYFHLEECFINDKPNTSTHNLDSESNGRIMYRICS